MMRVDILDVPYRRSAKTIGVSAIVWPWRS